MRSIEIDLAVHRAIELARRDFSETENDILRRLLSIGGRMSDLARPRTRHPRSSGAYSTELGSRVVEANSLKDLLQRAILVMESLRPGFIEDLARRPTPKGRFIVAREPTGLYPRSPQLVEFAGRLNEEWWYDTNVGRSQVGAYLRKFAEMLNLSDVPRIRKRSEKSELTLEDLGIA